MGAITEAYILGLTETDEFGSSARLTLGDNAQEQNHSTEKTKETFYIPGLPRGNSGSQENLRFIRDLK